MKPKVPTSYRLSEEAKRLLARLAQRQGVYPAAILEILIRDEARRRGIT